MNDPVTVPVSLPGSTSTLTFHGYRVSVILGIRAAPSPRLAQPRLWRGSQAHGGARDGGVRGRDVPLAAGDDSGAIHDTEYAAHAPPLAIVA